MQREEPYPDLTSLKVCREFKTDKLAENLQKQGAFIQGIRPGENTAEYFRKVSLRLTVLGALFLGVLSILLDIVTSSCPTWGACQRL